MHSIQEVESAGLPLEEVALVSRSQEEEIKSKEQEVEIVHY